MTCYIGKRYGDVVWNSSLLHFVIYISSLFIFIDFLSKNKLCSFHFLFQVKRQGGRYAIVEWTLVNDHAQVSFHIYRPF